MRKAFAIWLMAGLPLLADSVAATRSWVSNRVAEAQAEWRGEVVAATNPVPSWISSAEGRMDGRLGAATNAVKGWVEGATNGLPAKIAAVTNGLPERIAAVTNGLPAKIAAVTNGLPERIAAVTNGLPEAVAGATNGLPEKIAAVTNGLPERIAAVTNGLPERIVAATNGVMEDVNAATGSLWTAIGNIEGVTADIGALARTNDLPTRVSQLENDAGYLTNHVDVSNLARAAGVFPDWTSKGTWSEGEFCTWKGVVYRFTGAGDPSAQPDISPASWAVSDVGTAIAEARPDMSSLTNPIPSWIAASTNGLPERIAAATNGIPAKIAGVTNGLPERIASVTNGLPERMAALTNGLPEAIAAATNGLPEAIVASTNPVPSWIAAATGGVPARVSALVQSMVSGLDGKAATRLVSADGYRWIDGTGAVWQVAQRALWSGSQADAPLGETSFAGDGWALEWTDDGSGVTGSWDLYRTLSPNGPLVAHFAAGDLPYQEGMPVSLSLVECTVGGSQASVGQMTDHGWYQIADSIGSLHFVSPLVTTATVARVTNHVDRLAFAGELVTSNDVAAIVTNETEAVYGQTWTSNMEDRFPGSHVYWLEWPDYGPYGGFWTTTDSPLGGADLDGNLYATTIVVPQWEGLDSPDLIFTRDYTPPRNALGLARLTDVPPQQDLSFTNDFPRWDNAAKNALSVGTRVGSASQGTFVAGNNNRASGTDSVALGRNSVGTNAYSFTFNSSPSSYGSHGSGSFNVNPSGGVYGFWIGDQTFAEAIAAVLSQTSATNVPYYDDGGNCIGTNTVPPCASVAAVVANVATQTLLTARSEVYDTWHVPEYEGYSDLAYRAVWSNGRWYGFTINAEDGYGDLFISSGAGGADATTVTMSDAYGSVTWNRTGTATNDVPVYDIMGRQYDYMSGVTYVDGPTGDWFDIQTNSWHVWIADHAYYSPFTGTNVRDCRIFETANPTNWTPVTSLIRIPEGAASITGTVTWAYIDASHYTNVQVVLTPRSLNALGLARFSDLDKYAVPRQDLTRTVRSAVSMAADYLWDPLDEVCYRRQMSGGFLDYVAVTNIDVTLPENWQALEALEAERRSQQ